MRRPRKLPGRAVLIALAFTVTACADLSAVRDFAKASSTAAREQEAVLNHLPVAYDEAKRQAATPQLRANNSELLNTLDKSIKEAESDALLALEASKTLEAYFDVLASLADDKSAEVSTQVSGIVSNLSKLGASAPREDVSKLVSLLVQAWQSRALADLIRDANGPVTRLASYLAGVAHRTGVADNIAASVSIKYWDTLTSPSHDPAVQALVLKTVRTDNAMYEGRIAQANAAEAAFIEIGKDHDKLYRNTDNLSRKEVAETLERDIPILIAAIQAMQQK